MKNLLTSLFLVLCAAQAALASLQARGGEVTVLARGPAGLRIEGRGAEVSVDDETSALVFQVPIAAIDTGIGLRNRHMREALEADRYPVASLRVPRTGLSVDGPAAGRADAELTLHGQTHPVIVSYRLDRDGAAARVHGSFQIDMRDFGIQAPSYLGVSVAPLVDVEANLKVESR